MSPNGGEGKGYRTEWKSAYREHEAVALQLFQDEVKRYRNRAERQECSASPVGACPPAVQPEVSLRLDSLQIHLAVSFNRLG